MNFFEGSVAMSARELAKCRSGSETGEQLDQGGSDQKRIPLAVLYPGDRSVRNRRLRAGSKDRRPDRQTLIAGQ